jgi:hypothetical protein
MLDLFAEEAALIGEDPYQKAGLLCKEDEDEWLIRTLVGWNDYCLY